MIAVAISGVEWVSEPPKPTSRGKGDDVVRWTARMPRHELVAWGDETWLAGEWQIREDHSRCGHVVVAQGGGERDAAAAKLRATAVYAALTHDLTPST